MFVFQQRVAGNEDTVEVAIVTENEEEDVVLMVPDEVKDIEGNESSEDPPVEEERVYPLSTSKKRSKDSCSLADLLGQSYASGQYKKYEEPLQSEK